MPKPVLTLPTAWTQGLALELTDPDGVVADHEVERCVGDEAVVGHDPHAARDRRGDDAARRGGVDRVDHQHARALGQRRLRLLLLPGGVLTGVGVQDDALGAACRDDALERRAVDALVAGRLRLRQEQGDDRTCGGRGSARRQTGEDEEQDEWRREATRHVSTPSGRGTPTS